MEMEAAGWRRQAGYGILDGGFGVRMWDWVQDEDAGWRISGAAAGFWCRTHDTGAGPRRGAVGAASGVQDPG